MPEFKEYLMNDGTIISNESLAIMVHTGKRIMLIKCYKHITGESLKESKDAIDKNCCNRLDDGFCYVPDLDKTIRFFSRFIGPFPDEEELRVQRLQNLDFEQSRRISQAIVCASSHWKTLGFKSKIEACRSVLRNIERNPQD